MPLSIDIALAETTPFDKSEAHELLAALSGRWRGPAQLWLEPQALPETTTIELQAELVLGGRWLRLDYKGSAFGQPHAGEMLLGFHKDVQAYELAWIDSAHTGSAIMLSTGVAQPGRVEVLGSYPAGDQRWGWRTRLALLPTDELGLDAFNISPEGKEDRALCWRLARIG